MKLIDLTGRTYGAWKVLERAENDKKGRSRWLCRCKCGTERIVAGSNLRTGESKSCGCEQYKYLSDLNSVHHKEPRRLYNIWANMKSRCYNPQNLSYKNYGGRGISVCEEWTHDFISFREWAFSNGYADDLSIDRIDNDGDYTPLNCRWATNEEQSNNRRSNVQIEYEGEVHTLAEWRKKIGITKSAIEGRRNRNWSVERMLNEPQHNRDRLV